MFLGTPGAVCRAAVSEANRRVAHSKMFSKTNASLWSRLHWAVCNREPFIQLILIRRKIGAIHILPLRCTGVHLQNGSRR